MQLLCKEMVSVCVYGDREQVLYREEGHLHSSLVFRIVFLLPMAVHLVKCVCDDT